jgi:hypothetical protein
MFCTQFHPEVNEAVIRRWATGFGADELHRIGSSPDELLATTRASVGASRANAERLVDWFCETIAHRQFTSVQDSL